MRKLFFGLIIAGALTHICMAQQSATPLSLQACMDYAIKHNYQVKNASVDVSIQKAQNDQLVSAAYPRINGSAGLSDYLNVPAFYMPNSEFVAGAPGYSKVSFTPKYSSSASVSGSQVLFDPNIFIALQARNTVMVMARQAGELTVESVKYNVYKAYNALVIAYRQYDIIKASLDYARSIEHDIKLIQQNGFAEKIDVERTSVQINNLATDSIRVQNLLTFSEQLLKFQMGMDINTPIVLTDTVLDERKREANGLLLDEKSYDKIPAYNVLQTQLKLNQYNLQRYKLAAYPSLMAVGSMGYSYSKISNAFSDVTTGPNYLFNSLIGLQLNVPIYNGHIRMKQITEARLSIEKTNNSIEGLKQGIDFQVASSRTTLQNVILQLRSQRANMELADDVLELARRKYKAGVGSNLEVTQAQTDQLRAQTNYFGTLLDLVNAEADLKKALGQLR